MMALKILGEKGARPAGSVMVPRLACPATLADRTSTCCYKSRPRKGQRRSVETLPWRIPAGRAQIRSDAVPLVGSGRVNVISVGRSRGEDSGSAGRAYAKRDIYAVTAGARPEFPDLSFSRKDFEGIECPHEDPLVINPVIANFEVGRMLVDTRSSVDILFLDAYLKLGMSWEEIRPVATPLVGFTRHAVSPLGVANLMVTMGKHPQQVTKMVEFTMVNMA
ncbi:hypothetical protein LIER_09783 [Lithospermum erythrorhizon]|uniref:Uncharacterized protein n=1 Tax=Lithospermum erythrorhizon TaxID=34254 RepID=A0AAV3PI74_LITER